MSKTILITGSSSGFGRASALRFAREGWNVVATARSPQADPELDALPNVLVTRLDVQDPSSIDAAVTAALARFGGLDVLVNNAGFGLFGVFEATSPEKIREQFDVNLFGLMDVTRAVLPHFRRQRSGCVINVSSGAGVFGLPMISLYNASKFALEGFSESLSYELAALNIRVRIVEPGGVTSTRFGERSAAEFGLAAPDLPSDYQPFVQRMAAAFEALRGERRASAEDVADVIFQAATDPGDRLRYVATRDIEPLVRARRETSEDAYMALMRSRFSG